MDTVPGGIHRSGGRKHQLGAAFIPGVVDGRGLAGIKALYTRQLAGIALLAEVYWGQRALSFKVAGKVGEAGGTPNAKPSAQLPRGAVLIGAEGVAGRTGGHTSLTEGSYLDAPQSD